MAGCCPVCGSLKREIRGTISNLWDPAGVEEECRASWHDDIGAAPPPEKIDHPKHYNTGKFEVIDVLEDWKLNFHLGNVVKYIARAAHKGQEIDDLKKAAWYLNRYIKRREIETNPTDVQNPTT